MTLGDGILWSTILLLLAAGVYQISIRKKWKLVGKVFGVLVLLGAVIGGGGWGVYWYMNRPAMATELNGIRLGMSLVDVSILKGEPMNSETEPELRESDGDYGMGWGFRDDGDKDTFLMVFFRGDSPQTVSVIRVCQQGGYHKVLDISQFSTEKGVIQRLGEPSKVSIDKDGLSKYISYEQWNVAYEIEKGKVRTLCIDQSGGMTYGDEYGDEPEDPEE
jgi:hypothetical protein